jgi:hypothetical protein
MIIVDTGSTGSGSTGSVEELSPALGFACTPPGPLDGPGTRAGLAVTVTAALCNPGVTRAVGAAAPAPSKLAAAPPLAAGAARLPAEGVLLFAAAASAGVGCGVGGCVEVGREVLGRRPLSPRRAACMVGKVRLGMSQVCTGTI